MTSKRWRVLVILIVGAFAASAAVAIAGGSGRLTAQKDVTIQAGGGEGIAARCGAGTRATGSGFNLRARGGVVQDLYPIRNSGNTTFEGGNKGDTSFVATAISVCREREELVGPFFVVQHTKPDFGEYSSVGQTCPEGSSVTGGGGATGGPAGKVFLVASYPSSNRTWRVTSYQTDHEKHAFSAFAVCDYDHHYVIKSSTDLPPRNPKFGAKYELAATAKCRSDFSTTGGGFKAVTPSPGISVSRPKGSDAWLSEARLGGHRTLESFAICRQR